MANETKENKFDCVKWTREVRDQISAEIAGMSFEERQRRLDRIVRENPFYASIPEARMPSRLSKKQAQDA